MDKILCVTGILCMHKILGQKQSVFSIQWGPYKPKRALNPPDGHTFAPGIETSLEPLKHSLFAEKMHRGPWALGAIPTPPHTTPRSPTGTWHKANGYGSVDPCYVHPDSPGPKEAIWKQVDDATRHDDNGD